MSNYMRAIGLCLRRPWTLAVALGCSLVVAGFWGANIGAVYPLMEVLFSGRSLPQAVEHDIALSTQTIAETGIQIAALEREISSATPAKDVELQAALVELRRERENAERLHNSSQRLQGWVNWMPRRPFSTLIVLSALLLAGTVIKNVFLMTNTVLVERAVRLAMWEVQRDYFVN